MGGKAGEWRPSHQERYQQPFMTGNNRQWKEADIAFFVPHDRFSDEEEKELLAPKQGKRHGEIPRKATGHPAIILKRISEKSTHVLIVAISSHSATEQNNYQPPWEQPGHAWKKPNDFRALVGSQRPNHRPPIYLEDGKPMPKDRGWIRVREVYVVPLTLITDMFDVKTEPEPRRIREDSFKDLRNQMQGLEEKFLGETRRESACPRWEDCVKQLQDLEPGAVKTWPAYDTNWRERGSSGAEEWLAGQSTPAITPPRDLSSPEPSPVSGRCTTPPTSTRSFERISWERLNNGSSPFFFSHAPDPRRINRPDWESIGEMRRQAVSPVVSPSRLSSSHHGEGGNSDTACIP